MKPFGGLAKLLISCFQEKLLLLIYTPPVPITNTGARGEYPKASEITGVKELGKMAPYVRNKGRQHLFVGRSKEVQPTVYQKHSSLLKRKLKYRG